MLSKKFRLTVIEFHKNPNPTKRFFSPFLTLFVKSSVFSLSRFVILTPKSLDKRSVYRHETKRIVTETIRALLGKIGGRHDIKLKAKKIIKKEDRIIIEKEIASLFKKARLI